jgi:hypothetical protein
VNLPPIIPSKYPKLDQRPSVTVSSDQPITIDAVRTGITDERTPDSRQERYWTERIMSMKRLGDGFLGLTLGSIPRIHGTRRTYRNKETMTSPRTNDITAAILNISVTVEQDINTNSYKTGAFYAPSPTFPAHAVYHSPKNFMCPEIVGDCTARDHEF